MFLLDRMFPSFIIIQKNRCFWREILEAKARRPRKSFRLWCNWKRKWEIRSGGESLLRQGASDGGKGGGGPNNGVGGEFEGNGGSDWCCPVLRQ